MALIDDVKAALRISSNTTAFDAEISDLISSAKADLERLGVDAEKLEDSDMPALVKRAIVTYCKGHFGYDNPEADRFLSSYDMMRQELSLSSGYQVVTDET